MADYPILLTQTATYALSAGAASTAVPVPNIAGRQIRLFNSGTQIARYEFGISSSVAVSPTASSGTTPGTAGSTGLPSGAVEIVTVPMGATHVAVKADAGTTILEVTVGIGD
jgi:hypothetical protein